MATLDKKLVLEELQEEEELDQATGGRGGDGPSSRTPEEIVRTQ